MAEAKHTPGPWRARDCGNKGCWCQVIVSDALPEDHDDHVVASAGSIYKNNARLIAAAPELLEALRAYVREHQNLLRGYSTSPSLSGDAEAAIYKATGEQS